MIDLIVNKGRVSKLVMIFVVLFISLAPVFAGTTFYVTSDLHYGLEKDDVSIKKSIKSMQSLSGEEYSVKDRKYSLKPDFIVITGDLIHNSDDAKIVKDELQSLSTDWGIGSPDIMGCRVYASIGNHDSYSNKHSNGLVSDFMKKSYGGILYSFDTEDVHAVCLGMPQKNDIKWLKDDLDNMEDPNKPVVIFQHYPFVSKEMKELNKSYFKSLDGHNVVAIFCGHWHRSEHSIMQDTEHNKDYNVFMSDSPSRHSAPNSFHVVRIDDKVMDVLDYEWSDKAEFIKEYSIKLKPACCSKSPK